MPNLGTYLRQLREQKERSRRWVERQSRLLFPKEKAKHISHAYLRQIEDGKRINPNPLKLKTLAELYGVDHRQVLAAAGYLDSEITDLALPEAGTALEPKLELAKKVIEFLESKGIHSEYFMNSVLGLNDESVQVVNRLITTLSIQEKRLREKELELVNE